MGKFLCSCFFLIMKFWFLKPFDKKNGSCNVYKTHKIQSLICYLLCFNLISSVRFIEENITKMLETKIISKSEVLYGGGDDGDTSPATKIFQDFQINEEDVGRGGGLIRSWVDSMRACSPTHLKPFDNQSSWIVMSSCLPLFFFVTLNHKVFY